MNIQPAAASLPPQTTQVLRNATPEPQQAQTKAAAPSQPPAQPPAQAPEQARQPDRESVEAATRSVREFVRPTNSNLEFSIVQDTGQLVVKIVDRSTKEVIRQIPSEEMLSIAKALDSIKGLLVTQTA